MKRRQRRAGPHEATAYHEAGHAVADLMLGNGLRRVTVVPDDDAGSAGTCSAGEFSRKSDHSPELDTGTRNRLRMERRVIAVLAGEEAQRQFSPRSVRGRHGDEDRRAAVNLISYFTSSDEELSAYLNLLQIQARQSVRGRSWWPVIVAVAEQLLIKKTLVRREAQRIRDSVYPDMAALRDRVRDRMRVKAKPGKGGR